MSDTRSAPIRQARIFDHKFSQYKHVLAERMGLAKQEFRALESKERDQLIIHPDDLSRPFDHPVTIRKDLVQFVDEES